MLQQRQFLEVTSSGDGDVLAQGREITQRARARGARTTREAAGASTMALLAVGATVWAKIWATVGAAVGATVGTASAA